jgi:carbonic anhydrase
MTHSTQNTDITPEEALIRLKMGNFRFLNDMTLHKDLLGAVDDTKDGQNPFAAILSCMDSRTSAELIFDQGVGDIFSIRIAGNIISEGVLGSLEYAAAVAGSKLIMVMGHSNCGAIKGACDGVKMGHITSLLEHIAPAIKMSSELHQNRTGSNPAYVADVTRFNVHHSITEILKRSDIIRDLVSQNKLMIIPAIYNVGTGKVSFTAL